MKIYTRKGDFGQTTTIKGELISKGSTLIELQGTIDEVNSQIGHLRSLVKKSGNNHRYKIVIDILLDTLMDVQHSLFEVGVDITSEFTTKHITDANVKDLEHCIDTMNFKTGDLQNFIYLSGDESATFAHITRSTIRRSERVFVRLIEELKEENPDFIIPADYRYMNRLADYFFQVARYLNWFFGVDEEKMSL